MYDKDQEFMHYCIAVQVLDSSEHVTQNGKSCKNSYCGKYDTNCTGREYALKDKRVALTKKVLLK